MIVDLGAGQTADLRDRLSYEQGRDVRRAFLAVEQDRTELVNFDLALVRAYVRSWTVMDVDGNAVSLDTPEKAPDDIIQRLSEVALEVWNGKEDPKASAATSASSLRALG